MDYQSLNQFQLKQRLTAFVNRYEYSSVQTDGTAGQLIAFVEQKRLALKEEITFWASAKKDAKLFTLKAERTLDIAGRYNVRGVNDELVGYLRKVFGKSLLRSTWEVYDATDNMLFTAREKNLTIAIMRRVGAFIPVVGDFFQLLPFSFEFIHNETVVGQHKRKFGLRDNYQIHLEPTLSKVDRRLVLALGVALDALQSR